MRGLLSTLLSSSRKTADAARQVLPRPTSLRGGWNQGNSNGLRAPVLERFCQPARAVACREGHQELCFFSRYHQTSAKTARFWHELPGPLQRETKETENTEVKIVSSDNVRPSSPTPLGLRTYKLSLMDQIMHPYYIPLIIFFENKHPKIPTHHKTAQLKQALSKTLSRFYPLAGRVKDELQIDCNDHGAYYAEARVNCTISHFLKKPDYQVIQRMLPSETNSGTESPSGKYVAMIQVNVFNCGGIAISSCTSHKLIDGASFLAFASTWAAENKGSSQIPSPDFSAPSVFPQNPEMPYMYSPNRSYLKNGRMRRFVFDAASVAELKTEIGPSSSSFTSRFVVVSSLLWKAAARAAYEVRYSNASQAPPHTLLFMVNLREKVSPPLPKSSIGNIFWPAAAVCLPGPRMQLSEIVDNVKKAVSQVDAGLAEEFKGEEGHVKVGQMLKHSGEMAELGDPSDVIVLSSVCKFGVYETDFGWGKPLWFFYPNPGYSNFVSLVDTRDGDGVEATVTLYDEDMSVFERDPDIVKYASLDPSVLERSDNRTYSATSRPLSMAV